MVRVQFCCILQQAFVLSPASSPEISSARALSCEMISFFLFKLLCSSLRVPALAALRASKNLLHAERNLVHSSSPSFLGTGPIVFHSFCNAMNLSVVAFPISIALKRLCLFYHLLLLLSILCKVLFHFLEMFSLLSNNHHMMHGISQKSSRSSSVVQILFSSNQPEQ